MGGYRQFFPAITKVKSEESGVLNSGINMLLRIMRIGFRGIYLPFIVYVHLVRLIFGRLFVLARMPVYARWVGAERILRILGATIGPYTRIPTDICIQNARRGRCNNLYIGKRVYMGPRCLFDLASPITIEDDVAISAQVSFVTHADVGDRPLKQRFPRKEGPITVHRGAWLGTNTVVLHSVTIGQYAVVGAMSLVNKDIPANSMSFGIPCKVVEQFGPLMERDNVNLENP